MLGNRGKTISGFLGTLLVALVVQGALVLRAQESQSTAGQAAGTRSVGTVKNISGKTITLTTDASVELTVQLQDGARILRVEPGQKDLKQAVPLDLQDVQPGDRVLVRGKMADDNQSLIAISLIAMKKMDIAQKQAREREAWQRHGVGGLVTSVDPAAGTINISTTTSGVTKSVIVHVSKSTELRRYSPNSTKFDEAKAAPIEEIKTGDQLRARGARSADGSEITAEEIVSGSFRNVSGTISSIDAANGTITVGDLASKKAVVIKVTAESQLRKLPVTMAQRIAARLKGNSSDAAPAAAPQNAQSARPAAPNATPADRTDSRRSEQQGPSDLQQAISRMPAAALGDLSKGDAVMIVATMGQGDTVTAITLLAGVEPILEASPRSVQSILSPWSLSSSPGGETTTP